MGQPAGQTGCRKDSKHRMLPSRVLYRIPLSGLQIRRRLHPRGVGQCQDGRRQLSSRRGSGVSAWNAVRCPPKVASRPQVPRRIELRISLFIHLKRNLFSNSADASCICRNNKGLDPKFPAAPIFYGFRKDDHTASRFLFAQGGVPSVLQKGNDKHKSPEKSSEPIGTDQTIHDLSLHSIF